MFFYLILYFKKLSFAALIYLGDLNQVISKVE